MGGEPEGRKMRVFRPGSPERPRLPRALLPAALFGCPGPRVDSVSRPQTPLSGIGVADPAPIVTDHSYEPQRSFSRPNGHCALVERSWLRRRNGFSTLRIGYDYE